MRTVVLLIVVTLAACNSVRPRLGSDDDYPRPGTPTGVTRPPRDVPPTAIPQPTGSRTASRHQRICRTRSVPSGWVIISYEDGRRECPLDREGDSSHTVAVLESLAYYSTDDTLIVCADQRVPDKWVRENAHSEAHCPGARVREGQPTAMIIRKVF